MDSLNLLHDTTQPYEEVDYNGIEYTVCKDFSHLSRYRRLRQVVHYTDKQHDRFITLETQNAYDYSNLEFEYYIVPETESNRLDLISYKFYDTTSYSWVIAYINKISDGYTVNEGQMLLIPKSISELFAAGSILGSIPASTLNLGTE